MDYTRTPEETPKTTMATLVQPAPPGVAQHVAVNELTRERERESIWHMVVSSSLWSK